MQNQLRQQIRKSASLRKRLSSALLAVFLLLALSFSAGSPQAEAADYGYEDVISLHLRDGTEVEPPAKLLPSFAGTEVYVACVALALLLFASLGINYYFWLRQGQAARVAKVEINSMRQRHIRRGQEDMSQANRVFYRSVWDGISVPLGRIMKASVKLPENHAAIKSEIYQQAGAISELLQDIRLLNQLDAGTQSQHTVPFDWQRCLRGRIAILRQMAVQRQIHLKVQLPQVSEPQRILFPEKYFSLLYMHVALTMLQYIPAGGYFTLGVRTFQEHADRVSLTLSFQAPDMQVSPAMFAHISTLFQRPEGKDQTVLVYDAFNRLSKDISAQERALLAKMVIVGDILHRLGSRWEFHRATDNSGLGVEIEFVVDLAR